MKTCSKCAAIKAIEDFYKGRAECKLCCKTRMRLYSRERYAIDPQRFKAEVLRNTTKTQRSTYVYHSILRKKYGLEPEDYERMLSEQNGVCWICKAHPVKRRLNVDHCHKTGKVRGLLCWHCNYRLLPAAREDPEVFIRAALYLIKSKT